MKPLLLSTFLLGFIPSANAANTCNFVSEYYPDITIEVLNGEYNSVGRGTINYRDKPVLNFETGISNGYGGQYYVIRKLNEEPKKERETIAYGPVVSIIGNQLSRGTPKKYQKKNKDQKIMYPRFGVGYYYSLTNNHKKDEYGRFNLSPKMKAILNASEGFFVPSKECERFIYYGWN